MRYSSKYLAQLKAGGGVQRRVNFDLVIATSFYDGPESGFAFHLSGEGLKFSVVAESRFPIFRAFGFALLDGNWAKMVSKVLETSPRPSRRKLVFASEGDDELSSVCRAEERYYYLGVGHAYLDNLAMMAISRDDWLDLVTSQNREDYHAIHRRIKTAEAHGIG